MFGKDNDQDAPRAVMSKLIAERSRVFRISMCGSGVLQEPQQRQMAQRQISSEHQHGCYQVKISIQLLV